MTERTSWRRRNVRGSEEVLRTHLLLHDQLGQQGKMKGEGKAGWMVEQGKGAHVMTIVKAADM